MSSDINLGQLLTKEQTAVYLGISSPTLDRSSKQDARPDPIILKKPFPPRRTKVGEKASYLHFQPVRVWSGYKGTQDRLSDQP